MRVSIFVTCLVDQLRPGVGLAMVRVLRRLGVRCEVPGGQTCCGQPAYNAGLPGEARVVARQLLGALEGAERVVVPSGSCTAMMTRLLPTLFDPGSPERAASLALTDRVHEFSQFLVDVLGVTDVGARFPHRVTYHDSCHLLRDLGVRDQPRRLLAGVRDLELVPLEGSTDCCGFGGTFAVKYPAISGAMGRAKLASVRRTGADYVTACDTGCLLHLDGLLARQGSRVRSLHLAEILASPSGAERGTGGG